MGITIVVTGVNDVIISVTSLLFFFLNMSEPLNPKPFNFPLHTRQRPLLLHVRLNREPSSTSSACASTPVPHFSSTSKRLGTAPSVWPSPPHPGTAVRTTLLLRLLLLCRWIHASLTSSTCSISANPLPISFSLSVIMPRSLLIWALCPCQWRLWWFFNFY
jgi:hypothetical protein